MTTYVAPYTVTVTSTTGGLSHCTFVDANGVQLPADAALTTTTPQGQNGSLTIKFVEATVNGENLRLVGAAVKTVGNDPTMYPNDYLGATRTQSGNTWEDAVNVPWSADHYTTRGVVLLFVQVTANGAMVNFYPSADPQTKNNQPT